MNARAESGVFLHEIAGPCPAMASFDVRRDEHYRHSTFLVSQGAGAAMSVYDLARTLDVQSL